MATTTTPNINPDPATDTPVSPSLPATDTTAAATPVIPAAPASLSTDSAAATPGLPTETTTAPPAAGPGLMTDSALPADDPSSDLAATTFPPNPVNDPKDDSISMNDLGYGQSSPATAPVADKPAEDATAPAITSGPVKAVIEEESPPNNPLLSQESSLGVTETASTSVAPAPPLAADMTSTAPALAVTADPMVGVIETPGPDLGGEAVMEESQNLPAGEMPATEAAAPAAELNLGNKMPPAEPLGTLPVLESAPASPEAPASNKNLDILNSLPGGAPTLADTPAVTGSEEPKKGRSTVLLFVVILVIGIILFVVGALIASGAKIF